jgi:hypothetical protein
MINYPKVGRFYKHYKGGTYKVLNLAKHTETNEGLVIYQSVEFGSFYARPIDMWFDNVNDTPDGDGRVVYRFVLIDEK